MKGFSLLETMLALSLLTIGLLGAFKVHIAANQYQLNAYDRTIAVVRASSMLERLMVSDAPMYRNEAYDHWNAINSEVLPNGLGHYQCAGKSCTVTVNWQRKQQYEISLSSEI